MPSVTPSRIAIAVLVFSLASFLWTYGFPHAPSQPSAPVIDHYEHKNVHSDPIIPAPVVSASPPPSRVAEVDGDESPPTAAPSLSGASNSSAVPAPAEQDKQEEAPANAQLAEWCKDARGAQHVMVVLRTSQAETRDRLRAHLDGLLACVPYFAIYSDHAGDVDGIPVHNALDGIGSETKRTHDEFREYQIMHADPQHKPDPAKTKNLDKWKFLPMVYKAYQLHRSARFYLFIELDTSLSWPNMLQWATRLDYRIPYYSGSPTFINGVQLAQRGSGILLSQGAMRRYSKSYDELYRSKWEPDLGKGCCGDAALAQALNDAHVEFYSSWPLVQGEQPAALDYSKKHWCAPAVTWHNTNGDLLDEIWRSQKNWTAQHGWDKPFLHRDAFDTFVAPHVETRKVKWDNLSQDSKIAAPQGRQQQIKEEEERSRKHKEEEDAKKETARVRLATTSMRPRSRPPPKPSARPSPKWRRDDGKEKEVDWDKLSDAYKDAGDTAERCQKTCEAVPNCLQWRYTTKGDGECHLSKVLRLGKKSDDAGEKWTSGWLLDRVEQVKKNWACKEANWRFYQ